MAENVGYFKDALMRRKEALEKYFQFYV